MNPYQFRTLMFRHKMGQTIGDMPGLRDTELCCALIEEETKETVEAIRAGDLVKAIDGLCDLLYVTFGAAVAFGVDLDPFYLAVHRANIAKTNGPVLESGKRGKPEGWKPPDIAGILAEQIANLEELREQLKKGRDHVEP